MTFSPLMKGADVMCGCNSGSKKSFEFKVMLGDGSSKRVQSEQEARSLVKINGGSYTKVEKG